MKPYNEEILEKSVVLRTFSSLTKESELEWHWDDEDRSIETIEHTDWMFQFDNELPISMNQKIFIPRGLIHRVIKGTGDLKIKIVR
jgi:hypothetical protein